MTTNDRVDRLPELLSELAAPRTPAYLDDILARTARQRQRSARTLLERILPMAETTLPGTRVSPPMRTIAIFVLLILLIAALAVGAFIASRPSRHLPAPFGPAANGVIPFVSNGDLYVGDPLTGTSRLLVGGPADQARPQFSPDGSKIAYIQAATETGSPAIDIYVAREDGSGPTKITSQPIDDTEAGWKWIGWTPDGRHIAVVRGAGEVNQLDVYDASGSGPVKTIASAAGMDSIQFRPPDGQEILYRALVDGKWGLFAMDADGANVRPVVAPTVPAVMDLSFSAATYSADGSRIFYQHGDASGCCRLWVVDADGRHAHEFVPPSGPSWDGQAVVSPDGQWVAYWHVPNALSDGGDPNDPVRNGLAVVSADGTGPVIPTGPTVTGTAHWVWSPDSSKILMFDNSIEPGLAYLVDPAGGPWTTAPWQQDGDLDWQRIAP
jgi:Tol biopolymer transport system component